MATIRDFHFPSSNGRNQIRCREWVPDTDAVCGIVHLSHGVAEHIERYDDFADHLTAQGFAVVGNDHLGHGRSTRQESDRGYFAAKDGWMHVVNDMRTLQTVTAHRFTNVPYFLFGHSMGSFLARTYLIRFPGTVSGAVLCATGQMSPVRIAGGMALACYDIFKHGETYPSAKLNQVCFGDYNKQFKPTKTPFDWISANEANIKAYLDDPLCGFDLTNGLIRDLLGGLRYNQRRSNLRKMDKNTPILFIGGEADPVGESGRGVERAFQSFLKAGMKHLERKLYPGMRHEILNETNRRLVYEDVLGWLRLHG